MSRQALKAVLLAALVGAAGLTAAPIRADDTDIYVDNSANSPPASQPLVMFNIDYNPNLGSTICTASSRPNNCKTDVYFLSQGFPASYLPPLTEPITFFDMLRLALGLVLRESSGFKIGLMLMHNHQTNCAGPGKTGCSNGGYIARRFESILSRVAPDAVDGDPSRVEFMTVLNALPPTQGNLSHSYQGTELFFEFFRYLTGQRVYNGGNGWTDYATNNSQNLCLRSRDPVTGVLSCDASTDSILAGRDTLAASGGSGERTYNSPLLDADPCAKIFTINFLFQTSLQDNDSNDAAKAGRSQGGLGVTLPNNNSFNTILRFLRDTDLAPETNPFNNNLRWTFTNPDNTTTELPYLPGTQNVTSFFLARPNNQGNFDLTTESYASDGGTGSPLPVSDDPEETVNSIRSALQQILSVSTTLVAASVPVNVFNRSEIVDNVYFALFQAQGLTSPPATSVPGGNYYWPGNLKKLRIGQTSTGTPQIQDAKGDNAIAQLDGRILAGARSFWSDPAGTFMDPGDRNSDGAVDSRDSNGDGIGNSFIPNPTGNAADPMDYVPNHDGRIIARGGAGQKIPGFVDVGSTGPGSANPTGIPTTTGPRKLFYLNGTALAALNADNATAGSGVVKAQLGDPGMATADALRLLRYARGQDIDDEDGDNNSTESRFWILGDPLHSRPLPINYGALATTPVAGQTAIPFDLNHKSQQNPAIFIAMASNDGYLRMFRNTAGTANDTDACSSPSGSAACQLGTEVWAFMPPEGMAVQAQMANQTAPTGFPAHAYSFDGEPTALVVDRNGNGVIECTGVCDQQTDDDLVILYIGLRRGESRYNAQAPGTPLATPVSAYYALDVTNPVDPKFLWRITPESRTTSSGIEPTTKFAEMGQTFSRPRVGVVKTGTQSNGADIRVLAVFFGGGYHGGYAGSLDAAGDPARIGKDIDASMADDPKGNAIFIVRANNGDLLWKATRTGTQSQRHFIHEDLKDSIPSNVTTVDSNADGVVDRVYVGDTGGTLWRVDLSDDDETPPDGTLDDWKLTVLAKLGRHGYGSPTRLNDRRFFHEPDVIQSRDATGRFDAVVIGSGDRENPLDQGTTLVTVTDGVPTYTRTRSDVDNWFYMIKDRQVGIGGGADSARTHDTLTDVTNQCLDTSSSCTIGGDGWRLALDNPNGEKVLSAPVTIANSIFFTTYVPPPERASAADIRSLSCGPREGDGFLYAVKLLTGAPARNYNSTDGPTNADGSGTTDDDRDRRLDTPGIPAQVVYLGSPATSADNNCVVNILAGAQVFEAPGCPRFRTFWERFGQ